MRTTFTLESMVLKSMQHFAFVDREGDTSNALNDVLCEATPESVRLVSSSTDVVAMLHLTPADGYGLTINCDKPGQVILPLCDMQSILETESLITLSLDDLEVTVSADDMQLTLPVRPGIDYPAYPGIIPDRLRPGYPRSAIDGEIIGKFNAFARSMGLAPYLDLNYHSTADLISVQIADLPAFYGLMKPRPLAYTKAWPDWCLS
ncbi:MAG: hypothetical protein ACYC7E_20005 [Armatimonadota bacterium]